MTTPSPADSMQTGMALVSALAQQDRPAAAAVVGSLDLEEAQGAAFMLAAAVVELANRLPGGVALVLDVSARLDADTPETP